jgi:uncharacterized protein YecT (DUF1311 family)
MPLRRLMRLLALATTLFAIGSAGAAEAKDPPLSPSDKAIIRCQEEIDEKTGIITTADMFNCTTAQIEKAEKRLDAKVRALQKGRKPAAQKAIQAARKAWKAHASAECSPDPTETGSIYALLSEQCYLRMVEKRLKKMGR